MPELLGYPFDRTYAKPIERYRQVSTIAERDAIPSGKRWEGMLCYVTSENNDYQLRGGTSNLDWEVASSGDYFDFGVHTSDDITEGVINLFLTNAYKTILDYITVTQNINLDTLRSDVDALGGGLSFKGTWDASSGSFPSSANTGFLYIVDTAGTVDGVSFGVGDSLAAKVDAASTTTFSGNWVKFESVSDVTSVAGLTGIITKSALLAALNVEDGATADQTGAEITSLINAYLSNTNWQTQLGLEEVMNFVSIAIGDGTQSGIQVGYNDGNNSLNFTVNHYFGTVYANLATLIAAQEDQNTYTVYEITDASGFTNVNTGRAWVRYIGTDDGDEGDYIIISKEETTTISTGKIKIGAYWVEKGSGNSDTGNFEVGDKFDGWIESDTRYVVGKVIALPFDVDDETKVSLAADNYL